MEYRVMEIVTELLEENCFPRPFVRVSIMLKNVPLAANPKRAILITIKERWFHWQMEKTLVKSISKAMEDNDSKKTALIIMNRLLLRHGPSWEQRVHP